MLGQVTVLANSNGSYDVPVSYGDVKSVNVSDVDIVIVTEETLYVLPNAAYSSMTHQPPVVNFSDKSMGSDVLFREIGEIEDLTANNKIYQSEETSELFLVQDEEKLQEELNDAKKQLAEKEDQIEEQEALKEQLSIQQEDMQELQEKLDAASERLEEIQNQEQEAADQAVHQSTLDAPAITDEASVAKYTEEMQRITEEIHTKDYDYTPPSSVALPPSVYSGPPGVPAPLSLTPVVTLTMGNVVGSTSTTDGTTTTIYGGSGATGSAASDDIGPRDPQQFSTSTITGTTGNDIVYAVGPQLGNTTPEANSSYYAKEFQLTIAGYFTSLDDIVISGLPSYVTVSNATLQADGSWVLSAEYIVEGNTFTLIYDKDAWRSDSQDYFDMVVTVNGEMRGTTFTSEDTFRLQFMDVTDVSEVTDSSLTAWLDSQTKQIYILPTQDQPTTINHYDGDDIIYGTDSHDTITGGDGNNEIYAYGGDNVISEGDGNNTIVTLDGDDTITVGNGTNNISSGAGNDTITAGDGINTIVSGDGNDTIIAGDAGNNIQSGDGNDNITVGNGTNTILSGAGNDTIIVGDGASNQITVGLGDDTLTVGDGNSNTINIEGGTNTVTVGDGDSNIVNVTDGSNTITVGDGDSNTVNLTAGSNTVTIGKGTNNTVNGGSGNDTISLNDLAGTANIIYDVLGDNTVTVNGGNNTITTGTGNDTIIVASGSGTNAINAGDGNNVVYFGGTGGSTVTLGSGADTVYLGRGSNTVTMGTGNNAVNFSIATQALTIAIAAGTAVDTATAGSVVSESYSGTVASVRGSNYGDTITAAGADAITIYGGSGDDTITGSSNSDIIYGGDGDNTIDGGGGIDTLYGGSGDDTFINPVAGSSYDGNASGSVTSGEVNTIDYSAETAAMVIDLDAGTGLGGSAEGSTYEDINYIISGSGNDVITASDLDTTIEGGSGNDTLYGGDGDDTLIGGNGNDSFYGGDGDNVMIGGSGRNYFYGGSGADQMVASSGNDDRLDYRNSSYGVAINLDTVSHTFTDQAGETRTLEALSGASNISSTDTLSYAIGDTYKDDSNNASDFEYVYGSNGSDYIIGNSSSTDTVYYSGNGGNDTIIGSSNTGTDVFTASWGADRIDGLNGTNDIFNINTSSTTYLYLDGFVDIDGNGTADYLDRGMYSLDGYQGFMSGWGHAIYISNVDNVLGQAGNDFIVGNDNANVINARGGSNTIYGLGGDDTIICIEGADTIDGGEGSDTLAFYRAGVLYNNGNNLADGVEAFLSDETSLNGVNSSDWSSGNVHTINGSVDNYSTVTNVENLDGSAYADLLAGDDNANIINGNDGDDWITGNGGADTLSGGDGDDTFIVKASDVASVTSLDGGADTDTLLLSPDSDGGTHYTFSAGDFSSSGVYTNIEVVDVRDQSDTSATTAYSYELTADDIQSLVNDGSSSTLTLRLDTGDTFTAVTGASTGALSVVNSVSTATNATYLYYSDAGATNLVATVNITFGVV